MAMSDHGALSSLAELFTTVVSSSDRMECGLVVEALDCNHAHAGAAAAGKGRTGDIRREHIGVACNFKQHAMRLKVRELLHADLSRTLDEVSSRLHISSRTLIRKLQDEDLSFQGIKDELRRDLAILNLVRNEASLTDISYALGFSSPAVFHRAFRHWAGMTPGIYRAAQQGLCQIAKP